MTNNSYEPIFMRLGVVKTMRDFLFFFTYFCFPLASTLWMYTINRYWHPHQHVWSIFIYQRKDNMKQITNLGNKNSAIDLLSEN